MALKTVAYPDAVTRGTGSRIGRAVPVGLRQVDAHAANGGSVPTAFTADLTTGSRTIANVSDLTIANGRYIAGPGIPVGTTVVSGGTTATLVLSQPVTGVGGTGVALTYNQHVQVTHQAQYPIGQACADLRLDYGLAHYDDTLLTTARRSDVRAIVTASVVLPPPFGTIAATPTGTVAAGSASITSVSSIAGITNGMFITGAGIPFGAQVVSAVGSTITLSIPATAAGTGVALSIGSGVIFPVTWNGQTSVTIDPGATAPLSDPVPVELAAPQSILVRTCYTDGTMGGNQPIVNMAAYPDGSEGFANSVDATKTVNYTGLYFGSTPGTAQFGPTQVLADRIIGTPKPCVCVIGDSLSWGSYYNGNDFSTRQGMSWITYALIGAKIPFYKIARGGDRGYQFADPANRTWRSQHLDPCTSATVLYGTNDVANGRTAAQTEAALIAVWRLCAQRGHKTILAATIPPQSTSTDNFTTVAGQTTIAANAIRAAVNQWLRAGAPIDPATLTAVAVGTSGALTIGQAGHPATHFYDLCAVYESAQDVGKWGVNQLTGDTTLGSNQVTNVAVVSGLLGQGARATATAYEFITGAGIPAGTSIVKVSGTTITLSANASATATGVALTSSLTGDGIHPNLSGHQLGAAGVPVSAFA